MKISESIDLGQSLRKVFGEKPDSQKQVERDRDRQMCTVEALLERFFAPGAAERREIAILADEVGLGKTYVGLAVAVSLLDQIRKGNPPEGLPANKPVVLVLTPNNKPLYNKWLREAETFKKDCALQERELDWLQIVRPNADSSKSGNVIDLTLAIQKASRSKPVLLIAKQSVFGAALHDRDYWRRCALSVVFGHVRLPVENRRYWCRRGKTFENYGIPELEELLDLRKAGRLWEGTKSYAKDLEGAFYRVLENDRVFTEKFAEVFRGTDEDRLRDLLDDLVRFGLARTWPAIPLVICDEIHGLKNRNTRARKNLETYLSGRVSRLLGLSATPFQLRHDELLSVLELRSVLAVSADRTAQLNKAAEALEEQMVTARQSGEDFRDCWSRLRLVDRPTVDARWKERAALPREAYAAEAKQLTDTRIDKALKAASRLEQSNHKLRTHLGPFVIRHRRTGGHREHFVGRHALPDRRDGGMPHFAWAPGMEVEGGGELVHYLMMRAVALAKEEKGLPGLGAELTGSYRHLVETAAVWKKLALAKNPLLPAYREVLDGLIGTRTAESEHRKIKATIQRAMHFFESGQKTLIFCVYTKTAEAVRDELKQKVESYLGKIKERVFGSVAAFENFRRRFFNRREPLFSLIQDQPLLGTLDDNSIGVPPALRLGAAELHEVARLLVEHGESPDDDKPDHRLILAATEFVAARTWRERDEGRAWLAKVLHKSPEIVERIAGVSWLEGRTAFSRTVRRTEPTLTEGTDSEPEPIDPLTVEEEQAVREATTTVTASSDHVAQWVERLRQSAAGEFIACYFQASVRENVGERFPLLALHHGPFLAKLDLKTRAVAGQVFRRILMADEFLLRFLADVPREHAEHWADYLTERYSTPLAGQRESLCNRVTAYLETLVRAGDNDALLKGYRDAAENRNVIQLVQGGTQNRDPLFLGFNTPYRPEILISTSVGQEGIDLHRECRHVIHHDLDWNPAVLEQRTGRVDRIGSKVERECVGTEVDQKTTLEIAIPYLAATYDERMFEELYRRARLFEVTMGGDIRVEGKLDTDQVETQRRRREIEGIGTEDEDLGQEGQTGTLALPEDMVKRLRVDLSVWHAE